MMDQETDKLYRKKLRVFDFYDHFIGRSGGSRFVSTFEKASFFLRLTDNNNGVVDLALSTGTGVGTFTRATTAWTKLASGLWKSVASGVPRSSYLGANTSAGVFGGYKSENAGTQLVTPTASIRDMTGTWAVVTMTTAKTATGIDGVLNSASTITASGANSTILQTLVAAASSRTYSAFVRRKTGVGTCLLKSGAATLDITALINTSTYTRVSLTDSTLNTTFGIQINTSGDALEVDFNQFESGAFATSPMDAAGAVRNADVLTYVFAGNAIDGAGSAYAELSTDWTTGVTQNAIAFAASGSGQVLSAGAVASTSIESLDGTTTITKSGLTDMNTGVRKRAISWGGTRALTGDGATVATGAFDGSFGTVSIGIGVDTSGNNNWSGTIQNVRLWTVQLSNNDLQSITT